MHLPFLPCGGFAPPSTTASGTEIQLGCRLSLDTTCPGAGAEVIDREIAVWKPKMGEWVQGSVVDFEPSGAQHKVQVCASLLAAA